MLLKGSLPKTLYSLLFASGLCVSMVVSLPQHGSDIVWVCTSNRQLACSIFAIQRLHLSAAAIPVPRHWQARCFARGAEYRAHSHLATAMMIAENRGQTLFRLSSDDGSSDHSIVKVKSMGSWVCSQVILVHIHVDVYFCILC